jgi:hypothetical protein
LTVSTFATALVTSITESGNEPEWTELVAHTQFFIEHATKLDAEAKTKMAEGLPLLTVNGKVVPPTKDVVLPPGLSDNMDWSQIFTPAELERVVCLSDAYIPSGTFQNPHVLPCTLTT